MKINNKKITIHQDSKANTLEKAVKSYNLKEAAAEVGATEVEMECYTKLGWVKHKTLANGEFIYSIRNLNKFAEEILIPLGEKMGL